MDLSQKGGATQNRLGITGLDNLSDSQGNGLFTGACRGGGGLLKIDF